MQPIHRFVPTEAAQRELAGNVVGERPLGQVHDVWSFVDSYNTVDGTRCQQEALVLGSEFHVGHACSGIHKVRATHPSLYWSHRRCSLLANRLFPYGYRAIERAGGQDLTEFGVRPGQAPNGPGVCFPTGRHRPDTFVVLVPNLTKCIECNITKSNKKPFLYKYLNCLITGTCGHSLAMIVVHHIVDNVLMLRTDYLWFEHFNQIQIYFARLVWRQSFRSKISSY